MALYKPYPFQPDKFLTRGKELIESTKKAFQFVSSNCQILPSRLHSQSPRPVNDVLPFGHDHSSDVFGIFATKDIALGEYLFEDITILAASGVDPAYVCDFHGPSNLWQLLLHDITTIAIKVTSDCCEVTYCNEQCKALAMDFFHPTLCRENFKWLLNSNDSKSSVRNLLWLRTLAVCAQSDCHPLHHPQLVRLTPQYESTIRHNWSTGFSCCQTYQYPHATRSRHFPRCALRHMGFADHHGAYHQQATQRRNRRPRVVGSQLVVLVLQTTATSRTRAVLPAPIIVALTIESS